jgi:hypothetical protein
VVLNVINPLPEQPPLSIEDLERLRVETRAALDRAREGVEWLEARLFALKMHVTQHELFPPRDRRDSGLG